MRHVESYELIISRPASGQEILLLTLEQGDCNHALGSLTAARWREHEEGYSLQLEFAGGEVLQLAPVAFSVAEPLRRFERVVVVTMDQGQVVGEQEVALHA